MINCLKTIMALTLLALCLSGCSGGDRNGENGNGEALQRLSQIEVYSPEGTLVNAIADEEILKQFSHWSGAAAEGDDDNEQLEKTTGDHALLYTVAIFKNPAAIISDGALEKLEEISIYEGTNVIKWQVEPETIKAFAMPAEFLTFYSTASAEQMKFLLSLAAVPSKADA